MKIIILLISCVIALFTFLISLIAYPFIASLFDFTPFALCFIIGIPLFIVTTVVVRALSKEKVIRYSIIFPCMISIVLSTIIIGIKFDTAAYRGGYIQTHRIGSLYNNFGFRIISKGHYAYYSGIDEYNNDVIVGVIYEKLDYDKDGKDKYEFTLNYFDIYGNFINSKEFTRIYNEDEWWWDIIDDEVKYSAKKYYDIIIYEKIG